MGNLGGQKITSRQIANIGQRKSIFQESKFPPVVQNVKATSATTDLSEYRQPKTGEMIANVMKNFSESNYSPPPNYMKGKPLQAPRPKQREAHIAPVHQLKVSPRSGFATAQVPPNKTGLPDRLKAGVENLSGYSLDNVKVHYNSPKPAQLQALAYTQGTDIHVAPGQEKHLPHETWHVVQQMQGRVKPTMQMKRIQINDDVGLEREADGMGEKALQIKPLSSSDFDDNSPGMPTKFQQSSAQRIIQRAFSYAKPKDQSKLNKDLESKEPKAIKRFNYAETLTNTWGNKSDTSNFTHDNDSAYLNNVDIKWRSYKIGYLKPLGKIKRGTGRFNANVKMHLVNSYLNSNANNWSENWVFGHADLNHNHENKIEKPAKDNHPEIAKANEKKLSTGEDILALSYRTEVITKSGTEKTKEDLANEILKVLIPADLVGYEIPTLSDVEENVKIKDSTISDYYKRWTTAINHTVAQTIQSFARIYGVKTSDQSIVSEDITLEQVTDPDPIEFRGYRDQNINDIWLSKNRIITIKEQLTGSRSKRKGTSRGGGSPSSSKKLKPT